MIDDIDKTINILKLDMPYGLNDNQKRAINSAIYYLETLKKFLRRIK